MKNPYAIKQEKREDGVVVSTVKVPALAWYGPYETAIRVEDMPWRICEGYETKEEAIKGHEKYMNMGTDDLMKLDFIG